MSSPGVCARLEEEAGPQPTAASRTTWGIRMKTRGIIVAARAGFETLEDLPDRLGGIDFPVELALPWRFQMWESVMPKYGEMVSAIGQTGLDICSVHATQGKISESAFLRWGQKTCELAEQLGASVVTVHPDRARARRADAQILALQHLRTVQRKCPTIVSVETFGFG